MKLETEIPLPLRSNGRSKNSIGKILLVEDEVELKNILVESLTAQNYQVTGLSSGIEALEYLRNDCYDILLSDLMMPEMDGLELLQAANEIDPNLVSIMMTGHGTIQSAVDAMKSGAFDYVLKPFRLHTITPVLSRAMKTRQLRLENVQLREAVAIHELCQTIAFTLDPNTILGKLADAVMLQGGADEVSILLPTDDHRELYVAAVRGENREGLLGERIPFERSIASWVGQKLTPVIIHGEVKDDRFVSLCPRPEIHSSISMPMQVANKLIGVLNLNLLDRSRRFTLGQMKALSILAGTAAVALESASLQQQIHHEIEQHSVRLQNIVANVPGVVWETWGDSRWAHKKTDFVSDYVEVMLGYSREEWLATPGFWLSIVHPEDRERVSEETEATFRNGGSSRSEFRWITKDGRTIWVEVNYAIIKDSEGNSIGARGVTTDITPRRQAEEQLRQSQKMEAIGQLAGGVAHDFNNLLTAINGYSELALRRMRVEDPLTGNLEEIKKAGNRAASLTRQLLAFSRKQVLEPRVLDLNSIVSDLEKMLRRLIGENIELGTVMANPLGRVKADPGQIEHALLNLVVNARDAMPDGGKLVIETANVQIDEEQARSQLGCTAGAHVVISVSDTGIGMSDETQAHIFEPFFTTKGKGRGTGLGLSMVYGIVQQSGGSIAVESGIQIGTTFKIYLPQVDQEMCETTETPAEQKEVEGHETVLVVEDEDIVRNLATQILKMHGYSVLDAANGGAALKICEQHQGPIQLLLSDVVMPEMGGMELSTRLGSIRPDMKVLFMSGYTENVVLTNFLQKPFSHNDLVCKVREVLDA